MTRLTCRREVRRFVIRLGCAIIISQMATHARCRQTVVLAARVTLVATGLNVLTCQREARVVVVKHGLPVARCVTRLTCCRELCRFVIRFGCAVIIGKVTVDTHVGKSVIDSAGVTLVAACLNVLAC